MSANVTRTVLIDDLTPEELAALFCELHSAGQAAFFSEVWRLAKAWPGAGWCQQSYSIARDIDDDGRNAIRTLAGHVCEDSPA